MEQGRVLLELPASGPEQEQLASYARRRGFSRFIIPGRAGAPRSRSSVGGRWVLRSEGQLTLPGSRHAGKVRTVSSPSDLDRAVQDLATSPAVLLTFDGDRVIPLENLLALRHQHEGARGELWVEAATPERVPGLLGALEHGADAVVVPVRSISDLERLEALLEHPRPSLAWDWAKLTRVVPGGTGERVAVDTTSLLAPDEGLLVGSQGGFLFLVVSEARGSTYTRPRPFRVNAGAVHSYTLLADGTTRYLSELTAGDRLLVARPRGKPRSVRVGRLKIERRPFTLVEGLRGGRHFTLFAQEAETVRLWERRGARPVPELRAGQSVLGVSLPSARHFGMAIDESIEER